MKDQTSLNNRDIPILPMKSGPINLFCISKFCRPPSIKFLQTVLRLI